jgi:hypothetical protein
VLLAVVLGTVLGGCYADGNAQFLAEGPTRWYLTLAACEREATARYASGGPVYGGFECRRRVAGFIVETRTYYDGARIR